MDLEKLPMAFGYLTYLDGPLSTYATVHVTWSSTKPPKAGPGLNHQGTIYPGFAILAFYDISDAINGYILLKSRWN